MYDVYIPFCNAGIVWVFILCFLQNSWSLEKAYETEEMFGLGNQGWYIFKSISRRQRNAGDSRLAMNGRCKMQEEENGFRQKANIIKRIGHKFNAYEPVSGWWLVVPFGNTAARASQSECLINLYY